MATAGPMPISSGSTPATWKVTSSPSGVKPSSSALARGISSSRAAPSEVCEEFPAVETPSTLKTGRSLPRPSTVLSRGPSSVSKTTSLPSDRGGDGDDLVLEPARLDGRQRLGVRGDAEGILVGPAHPVAGGHGLAGDPHRLVGAGPVGRQPGVGGRLLPAHGHQAHRLDAAGQHDLRPAGDDLRRPRRQGLEARRAEAVHGHRRHAHRQAGPQHGDAGHVHALLAFGEGAAQDHIVDGGRVELRHPLQEALDEEPHQFVGPGVAQSAPPRPAHRSAVGVGYDDSSAHCSSAPLPASSAAACPFPACA